MKHYQEAISLIKHRDDLLKIQSQCQPENILKYQKKYSKRRGYDPLKYIIHAKSKAFVCISERKNT